MSTWTSRWVALGIAALLVPACSDDDSDPVPPPPVDNSLVAGIHFIIQFWGETAGHTDTSSTGTVDMDGAGTATLTTTDNSDGTIIGPNVSAAPYTARTNGSLKITPPGTTFSGGFDSLAELSVLTSISAGDPPLFMMTVRRNGTVLSDASMNGTYFAVVFAVDPGGPSHRSETGTATFDGAGAITASSFTTNEEGTISGPAGGAATYTVGANGTMSVTIGTDVYEGGLLDGGNVAVLASTSATSDPAIMILVKKAGTLSDADLDGAYWIATLGWKPGVNRHDTEVGSGTFNGAGNVTVTLTDNEEGVISTGGGGAATYSIAADGTLTLNTGDTFTGGVLLGGQIAIGATTSGGSDPEIFVAIKK